MRLILTILLVNLVSAFILPLWLQKKFKFLVNRIKMTKRDLSGSQLGIFTVYFIKLLLELECFFFDYRDGSYEISEAEGVQRGTKIILHLKSDCAEFSKEDTLKSKNYKIVKLKLNV